MSPVGAPVQLGRSPRPGPRPPGQAPVLGLQQAGIDEAIEVECRELAADPDGGRGLVASDRLVPGDDEVVQAAPRRLGEHCCDLDRVDVGESVGHGPSVTARLVMKRLDTAVVRGVTLDDAFTLQRPRTATTRGGSHGDFPRTRTTRTPQALVGSRDLDPRVHRRRRRRDARRRRRRRSIAQEPGGHRCRDRRLLRRRGGRPTDRAAQGAHPHRGRPRRRRQVRRHGRVRDARRALDGATSRRSPRSWPARIRTGRRPTSSISWPSISSSPRTKPSRGSPAIGRPT